MPSSKDRFERAAQSRRRNESREVDRSYDRIERLIGGVSVGVGAVIMMDVAVHHSERFSIVELGIGAVFAYTGARDLWKTRPIEQPHQSTDNVIHAEFGQTDVPPVEPQPPVVE